MVLTPGGHSAGPSPPPAASWLKFTPSHKSRLPLTQTQLMFASFHATTRTHAHARPALSRRRQVKQEVEDFFPQLVLAPQTHRLPPTGFFGVAPRTGSGRRRQKRRKSGGVQGAICRPSSSRLPGSEQRDTCARSTNGPGGGAKLTVALAATSGQVLSKQERPSRLVLSPDVTCCENSLRLQSYAFIHATCKENS